MNRDWIKLMKKMSATKDKKGIGKQNPSSVQTQIVKYGQSEWQTQGEQVPVQQSSSWQVQGNQSHSGQNSGYQNQESQSHHQYSGDHTQESQSHFHQNTGLQSEAVQASPYQSSGLETQLTQAIPHQNNGLENQGAQASLHQNDGLQMQEAHTSQHQSSGLEMQGTQLSPYQNSGLQTQGVQTSPHQNNGFQNQGFSQNNGWQAQGTQSQLLQNGGSQTHGNQTYQNRNSYLQAKGNQFPPYQSIGWGNDGIHQKKNEQNASGLQGEMQNKQSQGQFQQSSAVTKGGQGQTNSNGPKLTEQTQNQAFSTENLGPLNTNIVSNENIFRSIYQDCSDVIFRPFLIGKEKALLIYIEGMTNIEELDTNVLCRLMESSENDDTTDIRHLILKKVSISNVREIKTFSEAIHEISLGNPVIILDRQNIGISLGLSKWEKRAIEQPEAEMVVKGPREGFVETLSVNTSLLRRKVRSPRLKIQILEIGRATKTNVAIVYLEGTIDKTLIEEAKNRLSRIDVDGIIDSGMVEQFIEDNPYSPFPQVLETERPDVVIANLLEGRLAILVDGSPFVIVVPISFYSLLQASEDYYTRFLIASAIRWLRYLFLLISLLFPSLYVAVITYHQEMIPTTLLISMAASREQLPFPALVEALIMEVTFEALREAGLRLPKQVGAAVSIVGALVIGEAAVSAGIVSAPMVIVVAITGIASFTIPRYTASISLRMLRFPMIILAGSLGLLGIMLGLIIIIIHLCTLRSFGLPYLSPMAPMKTKEFKDVLIRAPIWKMNTRPRLTGWFNKFRQSAGLKPDPRKGGEK